MATPKLPRNIRIGTVGRDVLAVKRALHRLHHDKGMNLKDPKWGAGSAASLAEFLQAHGHPKADGKGYGPVSHALLAPRMDAYEKRLMKAVYDKLHKPKPAKGRSSALSTRQKVVKAARAVYDHRYSTYYTQDSRRWQGMHLKIRLPRTPTYSDCSSMATWCYWLERGNGTDILNRCGWLAGYTGTLIQHGKRIAIGSLKPGDLVFYGSPVNHVAVYVGNGRVVSHGHDPVGLYSMYYRPIAQCRSYL